MQYPRLYVALTATVFTAMTAVLTFFPRSSFSELEKRDLARFPEFTLERLASGEFTRDVSAWFSDSEPYRDRLMTLSMRVKQRTRLALNDESVTFHAAEEEMEEAGETPTPAIVGDPLEEYHRADADAADENAKVAHAGIIIVGRGDNVRALMAYGGTGGGEEFAKMVNEYADVFDGQAQVYCMVIPNATEFYIPEKMKGRSKPQVATIRNIHEHLSSKVKPVNVYNALGRHAGEDIYLRTDHHWSPLGGFYAANEFARIADVPFEDLTSYDENVVHGFVGSMYGYSKDISVKEAPEDFVYYVPRDVDYVTRYTAYETNDKYQITRILFQNSGPYFYKHRNGSSGAYNTFMGGDQRLTKVMTTTPNGRRLMIIKDSFGNTLPGYFFYSFEEVHVVDNRYFHLNMKDYVRDNGITDILIASSVFNAYSKKGFCRNCLRYLNQDPADAFAAPKKKATPKEHKEEAAAQED